MCIHVRSGGGATHAHGGFTYEETLGIVRKIKGSGILHFPRYYRLALLCEDDILCPLESESEARL